MARKVYTPQEKAAINKVTKQHGGTYMHSGGIVLPTNQVEVPGAYTSSTLSADLLKAIALVAIFGTDVEWTKDFNTGGSDEGISMRGKVPFSLSNLTEADDTQLTYNTQAQGVNDYSDKPYPVKGYLVVVQESGTEFKKDMDDYVSWEVVVNNGGLGQNRTTVAVGFASSSQSDFYTPFDGLNAVFFSLPKGENVFD